MKKLLALALALAAICLCFASCAKKDGGDTDTDDTAVKTDYDYIKEKGKLVVGITDFEPMDYVGENGEWMGFDADMATAFAKEIGVEVEFVEIVWDNKLIELEGKTIDCIWNGMTLTDDMKEACACSKAYCNNAQIIIIGKDKAEGLSTVEDYKQFNFAVEAGSAGESEATANGLDFTPVESQATALMEVAAGSCDGAIIDSLMAAAMVGEGTAYPDLVYTISLSGEEYGVAFRKGSDLAEKLNTFFAEAYESETMQKIAETYGVQAALIDMTK